MKRIFSITEKTKKKAAKRTGIKVPYLEILMETAQPRELLVVGTNVYIAYPMMIDKESGYSWYAAPEDDDE